MCSLVMSLCSRDVNTLNGSRLTGLTCSKAPGFWMVEHQLVLMVLIVTTSILHEIYVVICDRLCENRPCSHLVVFRETLV